MSENFTRPIFYCLVLLFLPYFINAQNKHLEAHIFHGKEVTTPLHKSTLQTLQNSFHQYSVYDIDVTQLDKWVHSKDYTDKVNLYLGEKHQWEMVLYENDIRGDNYQLRVATEKGVVTYPKPKNITYAGYVDMHEGGMVRMSIDKNFILGLVEHQDKEYMIQCLSDFDKKAKKNHFVVYETKDAIDDKSATCGVKTSHQTVAPAHNNHQKGVMACANLQFAIGMDYSMVTKKGSVLAAANYGLSITNLVQNNYTGSFNDDINILVVEQFISSCNTCDPWDSNTDSEVLLNNFSSWGAGGFAVTYDIGQLISNRNFNGTTIGLAWTPGACNGFYKHNVIQDYSNNSNRVRVVSAHEIGHNLNAQHDEPAGGYIMDPSANLSNTWSTSSINSINNFVNSANCIGNCQTAGCETNIIEDISLDNIGATVDLSWAATAGASGYRIRVREVTPDPWSSNSWSPYQYINSPSISLSNFLCNSYSEVRIQADCGNNKYGPPVSVLFYVNGPGINIISTSVSNDMVCDSDLVNFEAIVEAAAGVVEGVDYTLEWTSSSGTISSGTGTLNIDYNATTTNTVPPTISISPSTVVWSCGQTYTDIGTVTAYDDEDGDLTCCISKDYSNLCIDQPGTYNIDYSVEDSGGNITNSTRTVIVTGNCTAPCTTVLLPPGNNCTKTQLYSLTARCADGGIIFQEDVVIKIAKSIISANIVGANTTQIHTIPDCENWLVTWDDGQGNTGTGYTYDSDLCNSASGTVTFTVTNPDASPTSDCYQEVYPVPFVGNGIPNPPVNIKLKVFLQGTYLNSGLMETNLVSGASSFPLSQPFNQAPWNYTGSESVSSTANIPANTVDWILVELWDALNMVVDKQAGFLLNDGSIVDVNGNVGFEFPSQTAGYFTIVVRHRNHLDAVSSQMVYAPNTKGTAYDFTIPDNVKAGDSQLILLDAATSLYGLHAGDINADGIINVMDYNQYNDESTGTTINIYQQGDCNMDSNISTTDFNTYQPNASILGVRDIRY